MRLLSAFALLALCLVVYAEDEHHEKKKGRRFPKFTPFSGGVVPGKSKTIKFNPQEQQNTAVHNRAFTGLPKMGGLGGRGGRLEKQEQKEEHREEQAMRRQQDGMIVGLLRQIPMIGETLANTLKSSPIGSFF